jgi:hypothetical protein
MCDNLGVRIMRLNDGKNRPPEIRQSSNISNVETESRVLGVTSTISIEPGNDKIRFGGEDSERRDTFSTREQSSNEISGKIASQLINETEKQIAYHKNQASELEARLEELHQLAGLNKDTE